MTPRRIDYAGSVHDEREIEAVVAVLRGGPQALRIGKNVRAFEARVAELFGKRRGVMCNFERLTERFSQRADVFVLPRMTATGVGAKENV